MHGSTGLLSFLLSLASQSHNGSTRESEQRVVENAKEWKRRKKWRALLTCTCHDMVGMSPCGMPR
jgi:hypothetical protein